ncbi:DUF4219 domain containing protein, partial [Asbolus verrucosus]
MDTLTKKNFDTWKIHAQAVLIEADFWSYVSGEIPKPTLSEKPTETEAIAVKEWTRQDLKAKSEILLSISASE